MIETMIGTKMKSDEDGDNDRDNGKRRLKPVGSKE
jgi:hypothetical protein